MITKEEATVIKNTLDEYAKEVAIDFAKYVLKNYWPMGDNKYATTEGEKLITTEEIYELYIKSNA